MKIKPVNPEAISADPSVKYFFQADETFEIIHESSPKAQASARISPECVKLATELADSAGFPALDRIVATSPDERLMVFSLVAENAEPPGPRVFGLTTDPSVRVADAVRFIDPLL